MSTGTDQISKAADLTESFRKTPAASHPFTAYFSVPPEWYQLKP